MYMMTVTKVLARIVPQHLAARGTASAPDDGGQHQHGSD
eukprot:COSAG06_NODE_7714_length_2402_cov_1.234477_2_plen_39_part_00